MSFLTLLIISLGGTFTIVYPIVRYVPLKATRSKVLWLTRHNDKFLWRPKKITITYSPKLAICKLLTPFDISISLFLVFSAMLGLSTAVTGISMMVFNVLTAVGISVGVFIVHAYYRPKWEKQFEAIK
jgi:hypothetical protein